MNTLSTANLPVMTNGPEKPCVQQESIVIGSEGLRKVGVACSRSANVIEAFSEKLQHARWKIK